MNTVWGVVLLGVHFLVTALTICLFFRIFGKVADRFVEAVKALIRRIAGRFRR